MKKLVWRLLREAEQFVHDHRAYKTGKTGFNVKLPNSEVTETSSPFDDLDLEPPVRHLSVVSA